MSLHKFKISYSYLCTIFLWICTKVLKGQCHEIFCFNFATGINDTGGKFATGLNDTGGKPEVQNLVALSLQAHTFLYPYIVCQVVHFSRDLRARRKYYCLEYLWQKKRYLLYRAPASRPPKQDTEYSRRISSDESCREFFKVLTRWKAFTVTYNYCAEKMVGLCIISTYCL